MDQNNVTLLTKQPIASPLHLHRLRLQHMKHNSVLPILSGRRTISQCSSHLRAHDDSLSRLLLYAHQLPAETHYFRSARRACFGGYVWTPWLGLFCDQFSVAKYQEVKLALDSSGDKRNYTCAFASVYSWQRKLEEYSWQELDLDRHSRGSGKKFGFVRLCTWRESLASEWA